MMRNAQLVLWLLFRLLPVFIVVNGTDQEGLAWLAENAKKPGVYSSHSGFHHKLIRKGHGVVSPAGGRSKVLCHFEGRLVDGTVFESTYENDKPIELYPIHALGTWFLMLMDMVVGDVYELYVPSGMAVGGSGIDDAKVPANKAVIFTLELVEIRGKTKSALKCDPRNPTRNCNEMERVFIQEMKGKSQQHIAQFKNDIAVIAPMEPEKEEWAYRQLNILERLLNPTTKPKIYNALDNTKQLKSKTEMKFMKEDKEL